MHDRYPLPRLDDSLARLDCSIYITTLDLGSAFGQGPLRGKGRPKTAFSRDLGYQEYGMPIGLSNASATFQLLMSRVLMDIALSFMETL